MVSPQGGKDKAGIDEEMVHAAPLRMELHSLMGPWSSPDLTMSQETRAERVPLKVALSLSDRRREDVVSFNQCHALLERSTSQDFTLPVAERQGYLEKCSRTSRLNSGKFFTCWMSSRNEAKSGRNLAK